MRLLCFVIAVSALEDDQCPIGRLNLLHSRKIGHMDPYGAYYQALNKVPVTDSEQRRHVIDASSAEKQRSSSRDQRNEAGHDAEALDHSRWNDDKITCQPGEVPIGDFQEGKYTFSCCAAGSQCGGCRSSKNGVCLECAAGYVYQAIPVMGISKCFMCDDIPNWHDSMSRTCTDYAVQGLCNGSWPNASLDLPYHGLKPSEACCICGGGNAQAVPTQMPLADESLYVGQRIEAFPEPVAEAVAVDPECNLAELGLELSVTGVIRGNLTATNKTTQLKCSMMLTQDPIRGIFSSISLDVPLSSFTYGEQALLFKLWGQDAEAAQSSLPLQKKSSLQLENYQLACVPECPWLGLDQGNGDLFLQTNVLGLQKFPSEMKGSVEGYEGVPSCSCQVSAESANHTFSTDFVALQARLWRSGSYVNQTIIARIGTEIPDVELLEDPGLGFRWYSSQNDLQLPVLQNISTGELFVVSPSVTPMILDVNCKDTKNSYAWSRITGDVTLRGQKAFNLDPQSGTVSGVPSLELSDTQGRASVTITCQVALGGPTYDKVLPVANLTVEVQDDVCWVPGPISLPALWQKLDAQTGPLCLSSCRMRDDCAAVHFNDTCYVMVSDGQFLNLTGNALVRLSNCSEEVSALNLSVPGAAYVDGQFTVSNSYKDQVSYSRAGSTPGRQLDLVQGSFVEADSYCRCLSTNALLLDLASAQ
ncbi:Uncharacterized protein SCF082_LOCUS16131 [Durusdinium trenchii]|uniref:Ig-like domain-containing protein n=1 Tax=Durusdinium trenchii TaxID=1381693 RepID=A0ABP0KAR5_9DINO